MTTGLREGEREAYAAMSAAEGESPKLEIATMRWHEEGARLAWDDEKKQSWNRGKALHGIKTFYIRKGW